MKALARKLPPFPRLPLQRLYRRFKGGGEWLPYRVHLFNELATVAGPRSFAGRRILEIGPRDGLDSRRLAGLQPAELVFVELPEKDAVTRSKLADIACPHRYIEANYLYMSEDERRQLGRFDLIWCTGVLYHNAEQLRMLRKLFHQMVPGGWLVLESSTIRAARHLRDGAYVQVFWPNTFRDTGTITHLPSAGAIRAWLGMAGFAETFDSRCFEMTDRSLVGKRWAGIARKAADGDAGLYYAKGGLNPDYRLGDAT
jgi:SAM-dependent methyltransferase